VIVETVVIVDRAHRAKRPSPKRPSPKRPLLKKRKARSRS